MFTPGKKRILILCGDDAPAITAANVYADLLREHELRFLEEKTLSPGRIFTFSRRRLRAKGPLSLMGSWLYYAVRLLRGSPKPARRYKTTLRTACFSTDNAVHEVIRSFQPEIVLVAFCGLFPAEFLRLLPQHTYNIHPGINPRYRGFGNIWALSENKPDMLGYTVHKLDEGTDTGMRISTVGIPIQSLSSVPFIDLDVPVAATAAEHLAELILGKAQPVMTEGFQNMDSRLYGVPTFPVYRKARQHYRAALRSAPRHILITGAGSGIGKALAEAYAAPGIHLSLWARDTQRLEETARVCRAGGAAVSTISCDIRDQEQTRERLKTLFASAPVDQAILAAGVSSGTRPDGFPESVQEACRTLEVNACATVNMAGTLAELMNARRCGSVAVLSSVAAFYPLPDSPAYSASKAALAYYVRALRFIHSFVHFTIVYPGYVDSPMSRRLTGSKPLVWSTEKTAAYIRTRLEAGKSSITFPKLLALGTLLLNFLPRRAAQFFLRHFAFVIVPDGESAQQSGQTDTLDSPEAAGLAADMKDNRHD